jgi:membrane protein implicated in regulation of membrane protease activity
VEYAIALIVLAALIAAVVTVPLRKGTQRERQDTTRIEELTAAKEAKYREIRDAELDHRMGKLSPEDWRAVDRELRGEAVEILRELDRLEGRSVDGR